MTKALCGKKSCPRVCERVCHCEAGLERVHYLWLLRRGYRAKSELYPSSRRACPPGVDPDTGEIYQRRYTLGRLKEGALYNLFGASKFGTSRQPIRLGSRLLKPYTNPTLLIIFTIIFTIVLLAAFIINGSNLVGTYELEVPNYPPYEWMWEK